MRTSRRSSRLVLLLVLCVGMLRPALAPAAQWAPSVVVEWNEEAMTAIGMAGMPPPVAGRAIGIVHTCMYDAWAAYDRRALGTELGSQLRRPIGDRTLGNKKAAVSFAAYRALVDLLPPLQPRFAAKLVALGYDPLDASTDPTAPAGIGNLACAAVLAGRRSDGSNQIGDRGGAPYSDYTGYAPVNTVDLMVDPNRWQPVRFSSGFAPRFAVPHWGLVRPFAITSLDAIRPGPPPQYPSRAYTRQAEELLRVSARLTDRQKAIAEYWQGGDWNVYGRLISNRYHYSLDQDVKLFFLLGNVALDTSIAVWDAKRYYDSIRPISAIRFLFGGQAVEAWGGPFQGTQTIDGGSWLPFQPGAFLTPPHPEYVAAHSTYSAASAEILKRFTGTDLFFHSTVIEPGSSLVEPGLTPGHRIVLFWPTFTSAAEEAGMSRRYGGIHFKSADKEGQRLGRRVGGLVWEKAQRLFSGSWR